MGTISKASIGLPTSVQANDIYKRDVADTLRHIMPDNSMLCLVSSGGKLAPEFKIKEKNLIGKRKVIRPTYENNYWTPMTLAVKVTAYTSEGDFDISAGDATAVTVRGTLLNPRNGNAYRVSQNNAGDLLTTPIGTVNGATAVGDILLIGATGYERGSSDPAIISKSEDQMTNTTQLTRIAVTMDNTTKKVNTHFTSDYLKEKNKQLLATILRNIEVTGMYGRKSASTDLTTDSTLSNSFSSTNGVIPMLATSKDFGGAMTKDDFFSNMINYFPTNLRSASRNLIAFCPQKFIGEVIKWENDKVRITESDLKTYGVNALRMKTAGPNIELMAYDMFNQANVKDIIIIDPAEYNYVFLNGRDLQFEENIQIPSLDGQTNAILAEWGMEDLAGGFGGFKASNVVA